MEVRSIKGWIVLVEDVTMTPVVKICVENKLEYVGLGAKECIRCGWRVNEYAILIEADDVQEEGMLYFCPACEVSFMVLNKDEIGEMVGRLIGRKRREW